MKERIIHAGESYLTIAGDLLLIVESIRDNQIFYVCVQTKQHGQCSADEFRSRVKWDGKELAFRK